MEKRHVGIVEMVEYMAKGNWGRADTTPEGLADRLATNPEWHKQDFLEAIAIIALESRNNLREIRDILGEIRDAVHPDYRRSLDKKIERRNGDKTVAGWEKFIHSKHNTEVAFASNP